MNNVWYVLNKMLLRLVGYTPKLHLDNEWECSRGPEKTVGGLETTVLIS